MIKMSNLFRGFDHEVFIPVPSGPNQLHNLRNLAAPHFHWLYETWNFREGQDYHWVMSLSGPRGMGNEFCFKDPNKALMFKLARGGDV
jgi:hypothetical protein